MASVSIPLAVPRDLLNEIRTAARDTGLSQADVMRQSMKAGLPKIRRQYHSARKLKPLTKREAKAAFGPDPEWDALENAMAGRVPPPPEAD
jgi:hypothetical protein